MPSNQSAWGAHMSQFPSGRQGMMQLGSEMGFLGLGEQESRPVWAAPPAPRGVSLSVFVSGDRHLAFLHVALPWTWRLFPAYRRCRERHELSAAAAPLWAHCTSPSGACSSRPWQGCFRSHLSWDTKSVNVIHAREAKRSTLFGKLAHSQR